MLEDRIREALTTGAAAVPYWGRGVKLTSDLIGTSATIESGPYVPTVGDWLFFVSWSDGHRSWDARQVTGYSSGTITLNSGVSRTYRSGSLCWPILFGHLDQGQASMHTGQIADISIRFEEDTSTSLHGVGGKNGSGGAAVVNHTAFPVFLFEPNWANPIRRDIDFDRKPVEIGFGAPEQAPTVADVGQSLEGVLELSTPAAIEEFDYWTKAVRGRYGQWWMPDLADAVEIAAGVSTSQFDVTDQDIANNPPQYLLFRKSGQTQMIGTYSSVTTSGAYERITLASALTQAPDATWRCNRLGLARLSDDVERATFRQEGWQSRSVKVTVQPVDAGSNVLSAPIWLYHFTLAADTNVHWYFTSYHEAWTRGGNTYEPRQISHGSIRRNIRADLEEVEIETFLFADNPLAMFIPYPVSGVLTLEIREDSVGASSSERRYTGTIRRPRIEGKRVTARCASFLAELERKVPAHLFQPRCNYMLFDANCGLAAGSFVETAEILIVNGELLRVDIPGFSTLDADYWSKGRIAAGTGTTWETRTIRQASLISGTVWQLILNMPFATATVGTTVSMWPGCDGRLSTCDTKFSNRDAFGGFPYVPTQNLTLKTVNSNTQGGKK